MTRSWHLKFKKAGFKIGHYFDRKFSFSKFNILNDFSVIVILEMWIRCKQNLASWLFSFSMYSNLAMCLTKIYVVLSLATLLINMTITLYFIVFFFLLHDNARQWQAEVYVQSTYYWLRCTSFRLATEMQNWGSNNPPASPWIYLKWCFFPPGLGLGVWKPLYSFYLSVVNVFSTSP